MSTNGEGGLDLVVKDLVTGYGTIEVLHGISLTVAAGSAVGIVGANGAGKTTFLRAISGLLPVKEGSVTCGGRDLLRMKPHEITRFGIGHVPEGRQILQRMTVRENLFLACPDKSARPQQLELMLDTFPDLRGKLDQPGGQLSGGQQQMLAIARALMASPRLLLLDEPTLGLSPKLTDELYFLLARIREEWRATFVLVEQNIALAADLTEKSVIIQRGHVIRTESSKALMDDKDLLGAYLA